MKMYCPVLPANVSRSLLQLFGREHHELGDHVELLATERRPIARRVAHVADDRGDAPGQAGIALAAVEHRDIVAGSHRLFDAGKRNLAGTTDEKH